MTEGEIELREKQLNSKAKEDYVYPAWSHVQNYKRAVRGMAPQHLLDPKTRHKIYHSVYWLQYCFGVNMLTFIDRAQLLQGIGGLYGHLKQPCNFLCLFLKLLELEPSETAIQAFLGMKPWRMKYLQLLAALYVRFTYPCEQVYMILEPLLNQYNQVAILKSTGWEVTFFDEVIQSFIKDEFWCGVSLPPMTPRVGLPPRLSTLNHLKDILHEEVFKEFGMDKSGELFEVLDEKKKLRLKGWRVVKKRPKKKPKKIETNGEVKTTGEEKGEKKAETPLNEIEEENKLRAMLGLPLLH